MELNIGIKIEKGDNKEIEAQREATQQYVYMLRLEFLAMEIQQDSHLAVWIHALNCKLAQQKKHV